MGTLVRRFVAPLLILALALGIAALMTPTETFAKGKPAKCPWCQPTITLPDGTVCTLETCGSDCVYRCPIPTP